jgi:hypothetical protein
LALLARSIFKVFILLNNLEYIYINGGASNAGIPAESIIDQGLVNPKMIISVKLMIETEKNTIIGVNSRIETQGLIFNNAVSICFRNLFKINLQKINYYHHR